MQDAAAQARLRAILPEVVASTGPASGKTGSEDKVEEVAVGMWAWDGLGTAIRIAR